MKTSTEHSTQAAPKAGSQPAAPAQPTLAHQLGNAGLLRMLQAKLVVGDPQDHFEQEAERVADVVMRTPEVAAGGAPAPASTQTTAVQRTADATSALPVVDAALEDAVAGLDGRGGPLSPDVRSFMEPRFGADLSAVRVHTDAHAHDLARSVNARAFTVGRNVVFGAGYYAPQTDSGRRLIAHELTHTLQQGATTRLSRAPLETNVTQPYPVIKQLGPYTYSIQQVTDGTTAHWRVWNWARTDKAKGIDRGPQHFLDALVAQARDTGHDLLVLTIENIEAESVQRFTKPGSPMVKHLGATGVERIDERTIRMVIPLGGKPAAGGTDSGPGGSAQRPVVVAPRTAPLDSPETGTAVPVHIDDDGPNIHRPPTPRTTISIPPASSGGSGSSGSGSSGSWSSGSTVGTGSPTPSGTTNEVTGRQPADPFASTPVASTPRATPTQRDTHAPPTPSQGPDPFASTPVASTPIASTQETLTRVQPGTPAQVNPDNLFKGERSGAPERLAPKVERVSLDQWVHPIQQIGEGINAKYLLVDAVTGERWLFKPADGEMNMEFGPDLGIQRGERWRRALAAAYLAQELGLNTPYVRLIEMEGVVGSLQEWRQGYEARPQVPKPVEYARRALFPRIGFRGLSRSQLEAMVARLSPRLRPTVESLQQLQSRLQEFDRFWNSRVRLDIDAFDYFIANQDRHQFNVMKKSTEDDHRPGAMLIDQDAGMPPSPERFTQARSRDELQPWQRDLPHSVSSELAGRFRELEGRFPDAELRKWLTDAEVDGLWRRLHEVVDALNNDRIGIIDESPTRHAETAQPVSSTRRTTGNASGSFSTSGSTEDVSTGATTEDAETKSARTRSASPTRSPSKSRSPGSSSPTATGTGSDPDSGAPRTKAKASTEASKTPPPGETPLPKAAATIAPGPEPWGRPKSDVQVTAADAVSIDKNVERQTPQGPRQTGMGASASGHAVNVDVRTGGPGRQTTGNLTVTGQDIAVEVGSQKPGKGGPTAGIRLDSQGNPTIEFGWAFQTKGGSSIKPTFSHGTRVDAREPIELEDGRFLVAFTMTDTTTVGVGGAARRSPQGGFGFSAGGNVSAFEAESKQGTRIFKKREEAEAFRETAALQLTFDRTNTAPTSAADAEKIAVGETRGQSDTEGKNVGVSGSFGGTTLGRNWQTSETTGVSFYRVSEDLLNVTATFTQDKAKDWGISGLILANQKGGDTTKSFGITIQFNISTPAGREALDLYLKTRIPPLGGARIVGAMVFKGDGSYDRYQMPTLGTAAWTDRSWEKVTTDEEGVTKEFGGEQVHQQDPTWLAELTGDRELYSSAQLVSQQIHGKEKYTALINIKSEDGDYNREQFGKIFMDKKTSGPVTQSGAWTLSAEIDKKVVHELEKVSTRFKDAKNQDDKQRILSEVFRNVGARMAGGLVRSGGRFMLSWDLELKGDPNFPGPAGREKLAMQREELAKKLKSPEAAAQVVRETQDVLNGLWARRKNVSDEKKYTDLPKELREQQVALIDRHMFEFNQVRSNALMAAGKRDPNESIDAIRARINKPDAYMKVEPEKREMAGLQDKVADKDAATNEIRQQIGIGLEAVRRARLQDNISPKKYKKYYWPSRIALREANDYHNRQAELGSKIEKLRAQAFNAPNLQAQTEAWRQLEAVLSSRYVLLTQEMEKINDAGAELAPITKPETRWGARYDDFWAPHEYLADEEPDEDKEFMPAPLSMTLEEPKKRGRRR